MGDPVSHFQESLNKIGLTKKLDAQLRLWVNTGTVMVRVAGADTANLAYNMTPADNTFSNTCPIIYQLSILFYYRCKYSSRNY